MQATASKSNETALPRAIQQRMQRINDRYAPETPPVVEETPPKPAESTAPTAEEGTQSPQQVTDPRHSDPAYWQQRFKSMEGRLNAERRDAQAREDALNLRVTELQGQIASQQTTPDGAEIDLAKFFTPEQIEAFGKTQCEIMANTALKSAQETVQKAIEAEIKPLKEQQQREQARTAKGARDQFLETLDELIPGFAEKDADPEWHQWLAEDDDTTGLQRQEILTRHANAHDARKVAKMYQVFTGSKPVLNQPPITPTGRAAVAQDVPTQQPAGAGKAPTDSEVRDFFKRAALGKVRAEERTEFEARMKLRSQR